MILIAPKKIAEKNRYVERLIFALRDHEFRFVAPFACCVILPWHRAWNNARILICTTPGTKIGLTLFARILGMRVLWIEDRLVDRTLKSRIPIALYRHIAQWATIICAAEIIAAQLQERGVAKDQCVVISPGFSTEELGVQSTLFTAVAERRHPRQLGFSIGTVATLDRDKGVEHLLQGLKIAQETIPNLHLTIIGNGPKKQEFKWTAHALGIADHVLFVGWQEKYERWIQGFDLFIMPHVRKERWSHALLAAMAYKRAIVVTNVGVFPEVILKKETGIIIEPKNPSMIAEAIISLHANPEWRQEMGERAHNRVVEHFSFEKMTEQLKKIILIH